ncbi:MAG: hypothetical protein GY754_33090 [bacterium]|nr:hypothetical protein [bacterium]
MYIKFIISISFFFFFLSALHTKSYGETEKKNPSLKKRVAVMDFSVNNIPRSYGRTTRNRIEFTLYQAKRFYILEKDLIEVVVKEKNLGSMQCSDKLCAVRIGQSVSADYIVMGSIDADEQHYTITIRVVDVKSSSIVYANSITCYSKDDILKKSGSIGIESGNALDKLIPGESPSIVSSYKSRFLLSGGYLLPISDLAKITSRGYSISLSAGIENIFFDNLLLGIESGYQRFSGRDTTRYFSVIPFLFHCEYSFKFFDDFFLSPAFSFGVSFHSVKKIHSESGFGTMLKTGFHFGYIFEHYYIVRFGAAYCNIFETGGGLNYFSFTAGFGICF